MSTQQYAYYHRDFLNSLEHGGKALVECTVSKSNYSLHANLTLGDCGRQITLEFSANDEKSLGHMRNKIQHLQSVLAAISATLESQVPAQRIQWEEDRKQNEERAKQKDNVLVGTGVFREVVAQAQQAQPGAGYVQGTTAPTRRRRPRPSRIGTRRRA